MQLPPVHTTSIPTTNRIPKPTAPGPAIIDDDDDVSPPPHQAWTCAQHQSSQVHLINTAITKALMPLVDLKPTASFPAHGYIAATQALLKNIPIAVDISFTLALTITIEVTITIAIALPLLVYSIFP
jgi:hypothetical protein